MSTVPFNRRSRPLPNSFDKPLPNNLEAERSVLGAILLDNKAMIAALQNLQVDDFFLDQNRRIFSGMCRLLGEKLSVDLVTLTEELHHGGQLESAGGAGYLASLADGMPRVSNVDHYAKIVHDKAALRNLIHAAHNVQQYAFEDGADAGLIQERWSNMGKEMASTNGNGKSTLVAVDFVDFVTMNLELKEYILYPILPRKGIGMIYAWRGTGKTFFTLEIAYCVAKGIKKCFLWDVPAQRRVLYVDGEMDAETLQDRLKEIAFGHKSEGLPDPSYLRLITPDLQKGYLPKINTRDGQEAIEYFLQDGDLLILDNLAALCPSSQEDETGDWITVQEWLLHLRRRGISVLFMHHAGKGGTQRGFSGKEDLINLTVTLRHPDGYQMDEQLRAEVHLEKVRGKAAQGAQVQPFEITLRTDNGEAEWLLRPLKELVEKRAFEMFASGMKPNDIAQDLRLNRFQVYRLRKKFEGGYKANEDEN